MSRSMSHILDMSDCFLMIGFRLNIFWQEYHIDDVNFLRESGFCLVVWFFTYIIDERERERLIDDERESSSVQLGSMIFPDTLIENLMPPS